MSNDTFDFLLSNSSSNLSSNSFQDITSIENYIFCAIFAFIGIVGLVGNVLVIVAIASDRRMRKSAMNILLMNLAFADLFNLIVCIPDIVSRLFALSWFLPSIMCPLLRYLEICFLYSSLLTQVAVCIERFFAIAVPMKIHLLCSRKKLTVWTTFIWIMSAFLSIPVAVWNKMMNDKKTKYLPQCQWKGKRKLIMAFRCFECLMFYFLPLIVIVTLYAKISLILWSKNEMLHEGTTSLRNSTKLKSNESLKVRQNVVKMLIACVCVYFVCYSPIQIIFIAETFFDRYFKLNLSIRLTFNCLTYACSAGNPLLYSIFSEKFRCKFASYLRCTNRLEDLDQTLRRSQRSAHSRCSSKMGSSRRRKLINEDVEMTGLDMRRNNTEYSEVSRNIPLNRPLLR